MEQFNLSEWLKDKSRKIVTERNKEVRIVCTDINCAYPIIAAIKINDDRETPLSYDINGKCPFYEGNDLFFADEELTEFDYAILSIISDHNSHTDSIEAFAKRSSKKLLDLARKELTKNLPQKNDPIFELLEIFGEWLEKNGYSFKFPKSDTLKDLPKWKDVSGKNGAGTKDYKIVGYYLVKGNYAIYLEDLEKLPKEE